MSMRDYAVDDYGFVLDEETIKTIASKVFDDFADNEDYSDWGDELYNKGICEYIGSFTGEAIVIDDNGTDYWDISKTYNDGCIYYVPLSCQSTLFKSAYNNMEEIIDELKAELDKYFPNDFNYKNKVCHIVGTYFG